VRHSALAYENNLAYKIVEQKNYTDKILKNLNREVL